MISHKCLSLNHSLCPCVTLAFGFKRPNLVTSCVFAVLPLHFFHSIAISMHGNS